MRISVIVLNWNRAEDTLECLDSVYASCGVDFEVIVVDNGSTDGSLEVIRRQYPQARYIENGKNLGFAEGNNRAIEAVLEQGADFFFLLNNDAVIRADTLQRLQEEALRHPEAGMFGPKIYFYDEPTKIWYGGGDWSSARASFYHLDWGVEESASTRKAPEPTGYVCGCALFAKADAVREVGLMDSRFFLNWEEIDWCWRLRRAGMHSLFVPQAKAWHKISSSFIGGKRGPMWLYFYWRNRLLWMEKNLPRRELFTSWWKILRPEIRKLLQDKDRFALKGVRDYFLRRFGPGPFG